MSFGQSIKIVLRKYAEFTGYAGRAEFWWWELFSVLVASALGLFSVIPLGDQATLGWLLVSLWSIAVLLPTLAGEGVVGIECDDPAFVVVVEPAIAPRDFAFFHVRECALSHLRNNSDGRQLVLRRMAEQFLALKVQAFIFLR